MLSRPAVVLGTLSSQSWSLFSGRAGQRRQKCPFLIILCWDSSRSPFPGVGTGSCMLASPGNGTEPSSLDMCPVCVYTLSADLGRRCYVNALECRFFYRVVGFRSGASPLITSGSHLGPQLRKLSTTSCLIGGNSPEDAAVIVTADFSIVKMQQFLLC